MHAYSTGSHRAKSNRKSKGNHINMCELHYHVGTTPCQNKSIILWAKWVGERL